MAKGKGLQKKLLKYLTGLVNKKYPLNQSPFYCLRSKAGLMKLLNIPCGNTLLELTKDSFYKELVRDGRTYTPPIKALRRLHDRVQTFLSRIEIPDYLHSATKGRSNLTNALSHSHSHGMVKTDIKSFFPSISIKMINDFFRIQMRCSKTVAKLLSHLLTYNGALPKGSPCSTSLSFFINKRMFDEIDQICKTVNAKLTLYVDDCSISMNGLNRNLLRRINGIIKRNGYGHHKHRIYKPSQAKVVTGVVLLNGKIRTTKNIYKKTKGNSSSLNTKGRLSYIKYIESALTT